MFRPKKLSSVLATFAPVIKTSKEATKKADIALKRIPCIYYLLYFRKKTADIRALIYSRNKVNKINPVYIAKLGLQACETKVRAQNIDGCIFHTFKMILASFQLGNKLKRVCFFHETFVLSDISMEVKLKILLLTLSNANMSFSERELT